jgi:hypothetical protein
MIHGSDDLISRGAPEISIDRNFFASPTMTATEEGSLSV